MPLIQYLSVYLLGIVELWGAIPAGLAFKLHPVSVAILSAAGSITSAVIVLLVGEPLRKRLLSLKKSTAQKPAGKLQHVWDKYGVPGLSLIAPLLTGAHIGAAIALSLGGKKLQIILWMSVSCLIWATILTAAGTFGFSFFQK